MVLGPSIGVGVSSAVSYFKVMVVRSYEEEEEERRLVEGLRVFSQRVRDASLTVEQRQNALESLLDVDKRYNEFLLRRTHND